MPQQKDERVAAIYFATYASEGDITRTGLLVENGVRSGSMDAFVFSTCHDFAL